MYKFLLQFILICEYPSDNPKQKPDLFGLNKHLLNE